jgi:hypothetical protein
MQKTLYTLLVVALLALTASAAVVDLTPDNFDEVIKGSPYVFVEFFAPWYALLSTFLTLCIHNQLPFCPLQRACEPKLKKLLY